MPIERRRNAPNAAPAFAKLCLLKFAVFDQSIRRVCYHGMDRTWLAVGKPFKTIRQNESGFSGGDYPSDQAGPRVSDGCRSSGHFNQLPGELRPPLHDENMNTGY